MIEKLEITEYRVIRRLFSTDSYEKKNLFSKHFKQRGKFRVKTFAYKWSKNKTGGQQELQQEASAHGNEDFL